MKTFSFITLLFMIFIMAGCQVKEEHTDQGDIKYTCSMHPQVIQDHPGTCPICGMELVPLSSAHSQDSSIVLSENQIMLGNITTARARYKDFGGSVSINGKLRVNEDQTEVISSRVQGRIEKLFIKESGKRIEKGQPLYEMYSEQLLTLQQEYLVALKQQETFKDERYTTFFKAAEQKLLLSGMTSVQINQLAKRQTTEAKIDFLSPGSGVIASINVREGQYIEEGEPLFKIEKLDQLWVEAELYGNEESLVTIGDMVRVMVSGFENEPLEGKVAFLSPEYRQGSQIITLRIAIDNKQHKFLPGMQARVLLLSAKKNAIVLPTNAVIRSEEGSQIWIRDKDGSFKPRMVETGIETETEIEIKEGLTENENVVTTGAYLLYGELVLKNGMTR